MLLCIGVEERLHDGMGVKLENWISEGRIEGGWVEKSMM